MATGRNILYIYLLHDHYSMPLSSFTPSSPSTTSMDMSIGKMQIVHFHNEFPYDDQQLMFREILAHSKDRSHPVLAQFLDEATRAIREEIRLLPSALKATIPPFESVLSFVDFAELRKSNQLNNSVEGVILCIIELGTFIGYVGLPDWEQPPARRTGGLIRRVIGITRTILLSSISTMVSITPSPAWAPASWPPLLSQWLARSLMLP